MCDFVVGSVHDISFPQTSHQPYYMLAFVIDILEAEAGNPAWLDYPPHWEGNMLALEHQQYAEYVQGRPCYIDYQPAGCG